VSLESCALVMALYDSDLMSSHDPLGRVVIPLGPEGGFKALSAGATSCVAPFHPLLAHSF
jgi:hypothetical protein